MNIFTYDHFTDFLNDFVKTRKNGGHGFRSELARVAGCQATYVSRVLRKKAVFSLEQAERIGDFLGFSKAEKHYFLLLLQWEKAGTQELGKYFKQQLEALREDQLRLANRVEAKEVLSLEGQAIYYSSWLYAACHVLLSIPRFNKSDVIADALGVSVKKASQILKFLCETGLAVDDGGQFRIGNAKIHLSSESPLVQAHHINWRMRAMNAIENQKESNLHYSSVVTISQKDALLLKDLWMNHIQASKKKIQASKEELVYGLCMDFFQVI